MRTFPYTLLVACLTLALLCCACGPESAPKTEPAGSAPPPETRAPGTVRPESAATQVTSEPPNATVVQALREIQDRQRCNRVMGCKPSLELLQLGAAAVAPILSAVSTTKTDRYWRVRLVELLGQLNDDRAIPVLEGLLRSTRWEIRCRAAIALGRLDATTSVPRLQRMVEEHPNPDDPVSRVAALVALDRLGADFNGAPARERLALAFPTSPEVLGPLNPGYYSFLAEAIRESRLTSAIEVVRLGARHRDRFVREASLRTLGALQDTGGISVSVGRLDDPIPAIRRVALATLQQITGSTTLTTPEQWKSWCEARACRGPRVNTSP